MEETATLELAELLGGPVFPEDDNDAPRRLKFLGYLPCPIRAQIRDALHQHIAEHFSRRRGGGDEFPWYVPGGCGGKDVYEDLWKTTDEADLPEIILSLDFGDFWQEDFRTKFMESGLFAPIAPARPNRAFLDAGLVGHSLGYSMFAAFPHILLVDKTRLDGRELPKSWADLCDPVWNGEISIGGHGNDVSTLLPLFLLKNSGEEAVVRLARNAKSMRHSAQMAKLAGSGNPDSAALSILPWFFAESCAHKDKTHIHVPEEGALASPIYFLAKKNLSPMSRALVELLLSPEIADICRENWFPTASVAASANTSRRAGLDDLKLSWPGWDYLEKHDIHALKRRVETLFASGFRGVVG